MCRMSGELNQVRRMSWMALKSAFSSYPTLYLFVLQSTPQPLQNFLLHTTWSTPPNIQPQETRMIIRLVNGLGFASLMVKINGSSVLMTSTSRKNNRNIKNCLLMYQVGLVWANINGIDVVIIMGLDGFWRSLVIICIAYIQSVSYVLLM